jgi:hypothetical protein
MSTKSADASAVACHAGGNTKSTAAVTFAGTIDGYIAGNQASTVKALSVAASSDAESEYSITGAITQSPASGTGRTDARMPVPFSAPSA